MSMLLVETAIAEGDNPPLDTSAAAPITGLWWNESEAG